MRKFAASILLALAAAPGFAQHPAMQGIDPNDSELFRTWSVIFDAVWPLKASNHELCPDEMRYLPGFLALGGVGGTGIRVHTVAPGSPADTAGLKAGDFITSVNGNPTTHRNEKKMGDQFYDAWEEAIYQAEPMMLTLDRDGSPMEMTIQSVPACDIQIMYSGKPMPTMILDKTIMVGSKLDQYAANPEQLRMYIARDFASILLNHRTERKKKARSYNVLGGVLGAVTGAPTAGRGGMIANWREGPRQAIEADRMGLLMVARTGDDITLAPAYWQGVFANDSTNPVLGRLINNPTGTPERLEAIQKATDTILALQGSGEPLVPEALEIDGAEG